MSQEKVDRYKKEKANRAKIIKKEKRIAALEKLAVALVCAAIVFWIGFSVYHYNSTSSESADSEETTDVNISAISDFYSAISE